MRLRLLVFVVGVRSLDATVWDVEWKTACVGNPDVVAVEVRDGGIHKTVMCGSDYHGGCVQKSAVFEIKVLKSSDVVGYDGRE